MKYSFLCIFFLFLVACAQHEIEPELLYYVPENLGNDVPVVDRNPITKEGVLLGEKLFFDQSISKNGTVACATCHMPEKAFTDGQVVSDRGVSGQPLKRNTPTLTNVAWLEGLFWDGGALNLESLAFGPLTHPDEMAIDLKELMIQLEKNQEYNSLFKAAFPEIGVSSSTIARALAQYQRTLISGESAYDLYARGDNSALNSQEIAGLKLFQKFCADCHATDHFTDFSYHNNGLDSNFEDSAFEGVYQGRFRISRDSSDLGKYKTPTLRNIELTGPYMHDGRFASLEEVLDHYTNSVQYSPTLDSRLINGEQLGFVLSPQEKEQIIVFLKTLTDYNFINKHNNH